MCKLGITPTPTSWIFSDGSKELTGMKAINHLQMTGWLLLTFHSLIFTSHIFHVPFPIYGGPGLSDYPCSYPDPAVINPIPWAFPAPEISQSYFPIDFPFPQGVISAGCQVVKLRSCYCLCYQSWCCPAEHLLETLNFTEQFQYRHRMTRNSQRGRYKFSNLGEGVWFTQYRSRHQA